MPEIPEDELGQPLPPQEVQAPEITALNAPSQFPKPQTDFNTGDLVRLKSGGPIMTLGTVIPSHTLNNQVQSLWFVEAARHEAWFFLGQLEVVSPDEAKAQTEAEATARTEALRLKEDRQHELAKLQAANPPAPAPPKK